MRNKWSKKLLSGTTFSHFFHFFAVFTGIFIVMTVIILQIMRFGLYSTVDTNLQNAAYNANDYVARTMKRSDSLQVDNSDYESFFADENGSKLKSALNGETLTNVSVLLYDKKELRYLHILFQKCACLNPHQQLHQAVLSGTCKRRSKGLQTSPQTGL